MYNALVPFDMLGVFGDIDRAFSEVLSGDSGYPPYDILATGDNEYEIVLAVAGFDKENIDISVKDGRITVTGSSEKIDKGTESKTRYIHQGIARRRFMRKFKIHDYVDVIDATMNDGLLTVRLKAKLPEARQPKKIEIR